MKGVGVVPWWEGGCGCGIWAVGLGPCAVPVMGRSAGGAAAEMGRGTGEQSRAHLRCCGWRIA